jgi:hypothetical protein
MSVTCGRNLVNRRLTDERLKKDIPRKKLCSFETLRSSNIHDGKHYMKCYMKHIYSSSEQRLINICVNSRH